MTAHADRRRSPRLAVSSDLRVLLGPERTELRARLTDLSPAGMQISGPHLDIEPQSLLQVRLSRSDGRGATAIGRVVRREPSRIAFCFDALWVRDERKLATADLWRPDDGHQLVATIAAPRWWRRWGTPISHPA